MQALVDLASALVEDFDVVDLSDLLIQRAIEVLGVDGAGLILADREGTLHVLSSSSENTHQIETLQLVTGAGPCVEAFETGKIVSVPSVRQARERWPQFIEIAHEAGAGAIHALPLKARNQTIGAMNLFSLTEGELPSEDLAAARALADVATIAVMQHRALGEAHTVIEQLEGALNSRIVIEQAKGRLLGTGPFTDVDEAFRALRAFARRSGQRLTDVAVMVVSGSLDSAGLSGD